MPYVIQPMRLEDVDEVSRVERECFTSPWPASAYRREIRENRYGAYIVVRWLPEGYVPQINHRAPARASGGLFEAVAQFLRPLTGSHVRPPASGEQIAGFAGVWLNGDEAHITTIGVRPGARGRALGELMLVRLFEMARERHARKLTLEVRVSNAVAQALYQKYRFKTEGLRKRYYSDNGEDALIMWSDPIDEPSFQEHFNQLKLVALERVRGAAPPTQPRAI